MKIAFCFSGQIRTGIQTYPNIKRFIGELWDNCDFFVHTWNYESYKSFSKSSINGISLLPRQNHFITTEKIEKFASCYNARGIIVDDFESYSERHINPIWYSTTESFKIMKKYSTEHDIKYDVVIKIRPDVIFGKDRRLINEINLYEKDPTVLYSDVYTEIRLDDVFWILNFENACKMYTVFDYIKNNMTAEQDERCTVLKFLKNNNIINSRTFCSHYPYTIYRNESYMFDPMTQFKECFRNDNLHYGLLVLTEEEHFKRINTEDKLVIKYD
tara:strand:+ start:298 stop:1113 length:816 start_codon:yes stop_codon:yes gene_type:complete